jgi:dTDP-4-amino-4,6-dideoxygalactose transaminase
MDIIMDIAKRYNLFVVEDAAQAIDSFYKGKPLGGIGHFGCFSFHETKNIQCGEGGMLVINDPQFEKRAEIIWEKGTNRAEFFRGEVNKYGWVDIGSSFLPSEITAAFLYAQLEHLDEIQSKRKQIWDIYYNGLKSLEEKELIKLPFIPDYASQNGHMFYIVCHTSEVRTKLITALKKQNILAVFHYLSLHASPYFAQKYKGGILPHSDCYSRTLLRLPLFYGLKDQIKIIKQIKNKYIDSLQ